MLDTILEGSNSTPFLWLYANYLPGENKAYSKCYYKNNEPKCLFLSFYLWTGANYLSIRCIDVHMRVSIHKYIWFCPSNLKYFKLALNLDDLTKGTCHLCQGNLVWSVFQLYNFLYCFYCYFVHTDLTCKYYVLMRYIFYVFLSFIYSLAIPAISYIKLHYWPLRLLVNSGFLKVL